MKRANQTFDQPSAVPVVTTGQAAALAGRFTFTVCTGDVRPEGATVQGGRLLLDIIRRKRGRAA